MFMAFKFFPLKPSRCLRNYFDFGFFFPIIKAKLLRIIYDDHCTFFFVKPIINIASSKLNIHDYY